jgi:hypothetical protein
MTSPAQIAANQRNARKSIGPTTDSGKAAASRNALRHGLTARQLVTEDERGPDFEAFAAGLRRDLDPADDVEEMLVERVILAAWRLRRVARAERGLATTWRFETHPEHLMHGETGLSRMFSKRPDKMMTLSRYEATLDRGFGRALAQLERRQARRRGEHVPAPVTVLVEGPTSVEGPELSDSAGDGAESASPNPLIRQPKHENYETNPNSGPAPAPAGEEPCHPRLEKPD